MRITLLSLSLILGITVLFGCSGGASNPVIPIKDDTQLKNEIDISLPISDADLTDSNHHMWGMWTVTFDIENKTAEIVPVRESEMHFNVTPYLPAPLIVINSYDPVSQIVDVDFTIANPLNLNGYDVRLIIYTDGIGHTLVNYDDYTALYDIAGGLPINPFKAYRKDDAHRMFDAMEDYTENLLVYLPGGNPSVQFAIDASFPGNCEEPYEIYGFSHGEISNQLGSSTPMEVSVKDWQTDVNAVFIHCPWISGQTLIGFNHDAGERWTGTLVNNTGIAPGIYPGFIIAASAGSGSIYLYDRFDITIIQNDPPVPVITCTLPGGTPPYQIESGDFVDVHGLNSSDPDGSIIKYEWDFDYDQLGGIFAGPLDPDYVLQDNPSAPDFGDPAQKQFRNLFNVERSRYIALRVTDDKSNIVAVNIEMMVGPNKLPVAIITCTDPGGSPPYSIESGTYIDFNAEGSYDPDGSITKYEWDFDYDPVLQLFADPLDSNYYSNANLALAFDPPTKYMNNLLDAPASRYVALRITDDSNNQEKTIAYVEVIIGPNKPPNADLTVAFYTTKFRENPYVFYSGEKVTLYPGSELSDDGAIITYQYDFSYDGMVFNVDASNTNGASVITPPQTMGTVDMAIRVIDNGVPALNDIDILTLTVLDAAVESPLQVSSPGTLQVDLTNPGFHAIAAGANKVVCAWTQADSGLDIYYSVSGDRGNTWSTPVILNSPSEGNQKNVALAVFPALDIYCAIHKTDFSGSEEIAYEVSDPGCTSWPRGKMGIIPSIGTNPGNPSVCINPTTGQIYAAYMASIAGNNEIIVRTSSDQGTTWNTPVAGINTVNTGTRNNPSIAFNRMLNQVGVAWEDNRSGLGNRVYFNFSDASGVSFQPTDHEIAPSTVIQSKPSITVYSFSWSLVFDQGGAPGDVYYTASTDGMIWAPLVDCTDNTDVTHTNPSLCVDGNGVLYMLTRDIRETFLSSMANVYAFKSTDGGLTWVRGVRVNYRTGMENSLQPNVTGLPSGGFIAMYQSPQNTVNCVKSRAY